MRITSYVHAIKIPFSIPLPDGTSLDRFVFVYLIITDTHIWLVDSGVAGSESIIYDYIASLGRVPDDISVMILTHGHPDHIGAAAAIQNRTGCTVYAHSGDVPWIEDIKRQEAERPVPGFSTLVGGPVRVDRHIEHNSSLSIGGGPSISIVATPGHSPGSISLFLPQDHVLISGDAIPIKDHMPIYDDVVSVVSSIRDLQEIPDVSILLSSWDNPRITNISSIYDNALEYIRTIHQAVRRSLVTTSRENIAEICGIVTNALNLPQNSINPLSSRSIASHLDALQHPSLM